MNSSHDGWAHLTSLVEDLTKANSPMTTKIAERLTALHTGMDAGTITVIGEKDMQTICEGLMQSVRATKHEKSGI